MAHVYERANSEYEYLNQAPVSTTPFTMAAWFNPVDLDSTQGILCIANSSVTNHYWMLLADCGQAGDPMQIRACAGGTVRYARTSNGITGSGEWQHVCGIFTSPTNRVVVLNGDWANRGISTLSCSPSGVDNFGVGARVTSSPGWTFDGKIAEVAIWNAALTEGEIAILAKGYSSLFVRPQNLVEYWHLFVLQPRSRMTGNALVWANSPPGKAVHTRIIYPVRPAVLMAAGGMTPLLLRAIEKY